MKRADIFNLYVENILIFLGYMLKTVMISSLASLYVVNILKILAYILKTFEYLSNMLKSFLIFLGYMLKTVEYLACML